MRRPAGFFFLIFLAVPALTSAAQPAVRGSMSFDGTTVDPGGEGEIAVSVISLGARATNVVFRMKLDDGGEILRAVPVRQLGEPRSVCAMMNGEAVCRLDTLEADGRFQSVRLVYRAPDRREGGKLTASGTVTSDQDPTGNSTFRDDIVLRRMFVVTSAEDEGSGTLRQAILDSRGFCANSPCTIVFEGVTLIQPATPLPEILGVLRIDGRTTYVELDGSRLATGDGLVFANGCTLHVRNLVIRNFPGHGIEAREPVADQQLCPAGGLVSANGLYVATTYLSGNTRGIVAHGIDVELTGNVIHEQRRAGIFIDGSYYSEVRNNVVVNNGASGIFINPSTETRHGGRPGGARITQNVIHGNGEWGVALTANSLVEVRENSIARNGSYGIDVGLDLSSVTDPPKPQLLSATYDPVLQQTVIRGLATSGAKIDLYATPTFSAHPQGETYLGWEWAGPAPFEIRVGGDLRGQWITATASVHSTLFFLREAGDPATNVWRPPTGVDTSELSDAIQVP